MAGVEGDIDQLLVQAWFEEAKLRDLGRTGENIHAGRIPPTHIG